MAEAAPLPQPLPPRGTPLSGIIARIVPRGLGAESVLIGAVVLLALLVAGIALTIGRRHRAPARPEPAARPEPHRP